MPDRTDRSTPTDDALRDELARTRRDNARLRDELARVERERAHLERERDRLRGENERLKDDLEAARRAGARQAAPFSKGASTPHPRGNHSPLGAATQQVLASVLRTAHLRDLDAVPLFVDLLRAPTPTVSAALQAPRQ